MKQWILIIFCAFLMNTSWAHEYRLNNIPAYLNTQKTEINSLIAYNISSSERTMKLDDIYITQALAYTHEPFVLNAAKTLKHLDIQLWFYPQANSTSFSNALSECEVSYSNFSHKAFLLTDPKKDVYFTLTHEIGHCVLGKPALFKMNWIVHLKPEQEKQLNDYLEQTTQEALTNNKADKLPLIAYHETFADMFSILWLYHEHILTLNDIKEISQQRLKESSSNSPYISYLALENFISLTQKGVMKEQNINDENIIHLAMLFSQQAFVAHLLAS